MHGFVEHIKRYELVFNDFAEKGIATFAYDQRGFGETGAKSKSLGSTSWKHALGDVSYFINLVANDKTPLFLLGHSMGGALSLAFGTRSPALPGLEKLRGIISAAPLIRQAPGVKAPALLVKAGSFVGMLMPNMQIKTAVKAAASTIEFSRFEALLILSVRRTFVEILSFKLRTRPILYVRPSDRTRESRICSWV